MNSNKMLVAVGLVLGLAMAPGAAGAEQTLSVRPGAPTPSDTLTVLVGGAFPSACWNPVPPVVTCRVTAPDTLDVVLPVGYCRGEPDCACSQFPVAYSRTCAFGPLPAGTYVARFTELHVNPADYLPSVVLTQPFVVNAATPAVRASWGRLKAAYR